MSEIAHLLALEERRRKAMLDADGPTLRLLLASDLRYVHSTGVIDSFDSLFARLTSSEVVYQHLAFEQLQVTATDDAGVISGEMHAEIRKGDESRQLASRYMGVWLRRAGAWQFSAFQSTRLPQT
ncbi:nuclear transport factor 2 family protein [Diaphorobacter sp. HDW4A]|uniref:nuclear transport factor 2 family protein n=1 Tax=Diaphorobacter sp. HDW4A TaxID=2714924 RepID=UPI00140B4E92|nr:nuclear transport factor 2 family protein [Diaphorobacter sp. HDW4A]QIL79422.1 nuclear transport factor 2 family protein [Diaphorobacter sp. HDW4A]